jgi:hypothetical protein
MFEKTGDGSFTGTSFYQPPGKQPLLVRRFVPVDYECSKKYCFYKADQDKWPPA